MKDKRTFEKGEAIKVRIRKAGSKIEDVDATFLGLVKGENRAWVNIGGTKYRKGLQSIFKIDGKYIEPQEYYATPESDKAAKKAAAKSKATDEKIAKVAKAAAPKAEPKAAPKAEMKVTKKLDTTKEPKTVSKLNRLIMAMAKDDNFTADDAAEKIGIVKRTWKEVRTLIDNMDKTAEDVSANVLHFPAAKIERIWNTYNEAKGGK